MGKKKQSSVLFETEEDIIQVFEHEIHKVETTLERIDQLYKKDLKKLDKFSDKIAEVGGSWRFITTFLVVLVLWIVTNGILLSVPFDPFPFILLNLGLSMVAALQAPVILMSQNRAAKRDQARAELDLEKDVRDLRIDQKQLEILIHLKKEVAELKKKVGK
ncbi:DUF1003 domain-containing protein [Candidatus Woesearchaeota archaeon]|nr:DUF1003 domain-containing protein [Candidatus Woesearchaeota archaeon]